jgi:hypothetical protein
VSPATAPGEGPGPPPLPPEDLHARRLPIFEYERDWRLWRIHPADRSPLFFGPAAGLPPRGRWDAPDGRFRVCYLAEHSFAAFAESFLREPGTLLLETEDLQARALARVHVRAPLRLVSMHGSGLHAVGATAASCQGDYAVSRAWAAALHDHPDAPDGLRYRARHDDDVFAVALFDRAKRKVKDGDSAPLTDSTNVPWLAECLDRYGIGLI